MGAAKTPEARTATLAALRDHLATLPDEKSRNAVARSAISGLARGVAREGFASATQWIAKANLSTTELESFAGGLSHSGKSDETRQWIEWLGEKPPSDKLNANIRNIVRDWTENDYQAVGKWLATAPDGPARNTAIRSYAETVSEYEPAAAAQWALTLPPGKDRQQTLNTIYQNWPKGDDTSKAAAEAFKAEHGIK